MQELQIGTHKLEDKMSGFIDTLKTGVKVLLMFATLLLVHLFGVLVGREYKIAELIDQIDAKGGAPILIYKEDLQK